MVQWLYARLPKIPGVVKVFDLDGRSMGSCIAGEFNGESFDFDFRVQIDTDHTVDVTNYNSRENNFTVYCPAESTNVHVRQIVENIRDKLARMRDDYIDYIAERAFPKSH